MTRPKQKEKEKEREREKEGRAETGRPRTLEGPRGPRNVLLILWA